MNTLLRMAVIGCGPRGREHLKAALRSEQFACAAIADLDAKRREELGEACGVAKRYGDFRDMLANEKNLDAVHLCTQPTLRLAPVQAAVAAGVKAIVVEKPMALDYREALRLHELCREAGVLLAVNHQKRGMPEWIALKDAVVSGKLGKASMLRASSYGNLLAQGTHMLDMAWNVLGEPAVEWLLAGVDARESGQKNHPAPRNANILAAFANGVRASFQLGDDAPEIPLARSPWFWCNIEVRGTQGRAEAILDQGFKRWDADGNLLEAVPSRWNAECQGAGQARLSADLARALRDPSFKHPQRSESALVSFAMLEAACRSALHGGQRIEFPIAPDENALAQWSRKGRLAGGQVG